MLEIKSSENAANVQQKRTDVTQVLCYSRLMYMQICSSAEYLLIRKGKTNLKSFNLLKGWIKSTDNRDNKSNPAHSHIRSLTKSSAHFNSREEYQ